MESTQTLKSREIKWWHVLLIGMVINLATYLLPPAVHWAVLVTLLILLWLGSCISLFIAFLSQLFERLSSSSEKRQTLQFALGVMSWGIITAFLLYYT